MEAPPPPSSPNPKDMTLENKGIVLENVGKTTICCTYNGSKLRQTTTRKDLKKNTRFSMKRRGTIRREGSRRGEIEIRKRVRVLKRLIPNPESNGLEGLFKDTAAYIMALQMRVRVMKTMVDVLTTTQE